ncbi:hypothetical protein ACFQVD_26645 [Streptosporangium amethystogenes subsp. fukuiense]|uniref:Uncharacterized protein n=1 Tax=Streptosporangium amethystogenes subsp. fukuiense TaxID=698418 RepID=A0ABW2T4Y2_9ACTN
MDKPNPDEPLTVTYTTPEGKKRRPVTREQMENGQFGRLLNRMADKEKAWDIAVLTADGEDIAETLTCFT